MSDETTHCVYCAHLRDSYCYLETSPNEPFESKDRAIENDLASKARAIHGLSGLSLPSTSASGARVDSIYNLEDLNIVSHYASSNAAVAGLPFEKTQFYQRVHSQSGYSSQPEIFSRAAKGFFLADDFWTSYRRNYFSVECYFVLELDSFAALYLHKSGHERVPIEQFAFRLSATADNADGKTLDLVCHSSQRVLGSLGRLESMKVNPQCSVLGKGSYDAQNGTVAYFERIQFKNATANNGKRRAKQQLFHLIVELFAYTTKDIGEGKWMRIARQVSSPLVVRGRSPGHYGEDRRDDIAKASSSGSYLSDSTVPRAGELPSTVASRFSGHVELASGAEAPSKPVKPEITYRVSIPTKVEQEIRIQPMQLPASKLANAESCSTSGITHADDGENSSISSISNPFSQSTMSSVSSTAGPVEAMCGLVALLLEDRGLEAMCHDGFTKLDPHRFERNLRRLLKIFAAGLRREASSEQENTAARFIKAGARHVASMIGRKFRPDDVRKAQRMQEISAQTPQKEHILYKYFNQCRTNENEQVEVNDTGIDSSDSDAQEDIDQTSSLIDFSQLKHWIANSEALQDLKEGLMGFLVPILSPASNSTMLAKRADQNAENNDLLGLGKKADPKFYHNIISSVVDVCDALGKAEKELQTGNSWSASNKRNSWVSVLNRLFSESRTELELLQNQLEKDSMRRLQERYQYKDKENQEDQKRAVDSISGPQGDRSHSNFLYAFVGDRQRQLVSQTAQLRAIIEYLEASSHLAGRGESGLNKLMQFLFRRICNEVFVKTWQKITRPRIPQGYRRLEWTCDCGENVWGDFDNSYPDAVNALVEILSCTTPQIPTGNSHNQIFDITTATETAFTAEPRNHERQSKPYSNAEHNPTVATCKISPSSNLMVEKYLELCVNTGEYDISLAEVSILSSGSNITNDGELFQEIKRQYNQHRGFLKTHNLHFFRPTEVLFVKFCLEDGDVGILDGPLSLPTEDHVKAKTWEFCPCPLDDPPPIPNQVFLHHLNSKRNHPRATWLDRLPKKLNSSIHQGSSPLHLGWQATGWGIYIVEGPNQRAILWFTVAIVVVSLGVALLWAFLKDDVQGAFGIAAYVVTSVSALLFAFFHYYPVKHFPRS